ncbi:Beta-lactamase [Brevibacterium sandarakinum]|uniref:Beta-lactamase n=1 Tax=Brevibacterium sandarakinum TaxID=629680 RepID=A0A1H1QC64_BRESA|nr:Beta-lactamase [Brevibacterium sandarakinum]
MNSRVPSTRRAFVGLYEHGRRDVKVQHRAYSADAHLEWGSVTKTVTAGLLKVLSIDGVLDLRTSVADLLPIPSLEHTSLQELTLHRAGLPPMHAGAPTGLVRDPSTGCDRTRFLSEIAPRITVNEEISGKFNYSNLGYALLGLALEEATGRSWFELVRTHLLPASRYPSLTTCPPLGSYPTTMGISRRPWQLGRGVYASAGGLWSRGDDLLRYAEDTSSMPPSPGWFVLRGGVLFHNGQTRDAGCSVMVDQRNGRASVAHTLFRMPRTPQRLAEHALFGNGAHS